MYRFIIVFCSLIAAVSGYAQGGDYLYLDAENNQAFYVKLDGKVHSSSASGYLILTGLNERSLSFSIGFPKDRYPEQRFTIPMDNDDQGFHLKNLPEKGWTLINLKTNEQIPNTTPPKAAAEDTAVIKRTDAFSILLSKVVNDPAVLINTPQIPEPADKVAAKAVADHNGQNPGDSAMIVANQDAGMDSALSAANRDTKSLGDSAAAVISQETRKPGDSTAVTASRDSVNLRDSSVAAVQQTADEKKQEPIQKERPLIVKKPSDVLKLYDQQFEQRYEAVYVDKSEGSSDTIRLSYPIAPEVTAVADKQEATPKVPATERATEKEQPAFPENKTTAEKPEEPAMEQDSSAAGKVILVNTDCKDFADEQDVDKLRVKILKEKNIEDRFAAARKYFKQKCFTVKQIKALSELFPEDEYKYQFFELAYPFISDFSNFPELEELFMTSYYRNRFKTLIRK